MVKRRIFIASSSEGLEIARAVQAGLEGDGEARIWSQDVFLPGESILQSLTKALAASDFGVFVFSRDDLLGIRGTEAMSPRDNVVFEAGLAIGLLGHRRTFVVRPKDDDLRMPSDLAGINVASFDAHRSDGDLLAALGPACGKLRKAMRQPNDFPLEPILRLPVLQRKESLTPNMLQLLYFVEMHGPCPRSRLAEVFRLPEAELFYRLQVLRLLSLVSVDGAPERQGDAAVRVNEDYARARDELAPPSHLARSSLPVRPSVRAASKV